MSDREEMLALANECQFVGSGKTGCNPYQLLCRAAAALRSTARTGPDVADNGILNAAKFVASRDREMLAQMLFALHERHDSPSPIRFNCSWKQLKSFNRASFYKCADDIRAIAAIPAPATAAAGWQDIEAAPKDGTPLLLGWPTFHPLVGHCEDGSWGELDSDFGFEPFENTPTHWMPLPAAPTITRKSEERS